MQGQLLTNLLATRDLATLSRTLMAVLAASICGGAISAAVATGNQGMVASRSPLASAAGIEVMKQGGNAVDAAVATAFTLAVTYPSAGNLGGGGFAVIALPTGEVFTNDHREKAPLGASRNMFVDAHGEVSSALSLRSHLASGVPGSVEGLLNMHARFGSVSRQAVMRRAIELAREGFALPADIARQFAGRLDRWQQVASSARVFLKADGTPYEAGETFRQLDLAATLERIAEQGRDGFYKGRTAELIAAEMARGGGLISLRDLETYSSVWRDPIHTTYRGIDVYAMAPPSSGGAILAEMLNMIEPHDVGELGFGQPATMHLMIEAERRAYADRAVHLGDSDFYPVPIESLLQKSFAVTRMHDFDRTQATRSAEVAAGLVAVPAESPETTHFSVIDKEGMAVSFTTTINSGYGSGIVVDGAGFLLNNEMDDFSAKPGVPNRYGLVGAEANAIEAGKRMLSSMTPTILMRDGKPWVLTGSPGGSTIITTVFQVVVNVVDHQMTVADAVAMPRFHHQWLPDQVWLEQGFAAEVLTKLKSMGHNLQEGALGRTSIGDANSLMVTDDTYIGVSDPRSDGAALGY